MGSKNLKAVVIDGAGGPGVTVADPAALKAASKTLAKGIHSHPAMAALEALGSAFLINVTQSMGCLATKNFSAGTWENAQDISGERMVELISSRPNGATKHSCMKGCIINCSQVYTDDAGEVITSGVEFETIGLMGSNCHINDLDAIARLDRLCDDLGLDTMDIGAAMGVAMEGGLLEWGDGAGAFAMLAKLTKATRTHACSPTGASLPVSGSASRACRRSRARASRPTTRASSRAPGRRTSPALREPTTPAATPCPARRTRRYEQDRPGPGTDVGVPAVLLRGHRLARHVSVRDAAGARHAGAAGRVRQGGGRRHRQELPEDYLIKMGDQIVRLERDFNRRAGFTEKDDRPPAFIVEEAVLPSGNRYDVARPTWTRCSRADHERK